MAAGARSPLTGTNFQYHLEGGCSGSGRKAGEECQRAGPGEQDATPAPTRCPGLRAKLCPVPVSRTLPLPGDHSGRPRAPLQHQPLQEQRTLRKLGAGWSPKGTDAKCTWQGVVQCVTCAHRGKRRNNGARRVGRAQREPGDRGRADSGTDVLGKPTASGAGRTEVAALQGQRLHRASRHVAPLPFPTPRGGPRGGARLLDLVTPSSPADF